MKKLFLLCLLSFITACSTTNKSYEISEPPWPASSFYWDYTLLTPSSGYDLKGPVKRVHERIYGAQMLDNKLEKRKELQISGCCDNNTILYFDPQGRISFEYTYYYLEPPENSSIKSFVYYYDGKLMQSLRYSRDKVLSDSDFYIYDEKGRFKKVISKHSGLEENEPYWTTWETYTYNDSLNTILVETFAEQGPLRNTIFQLDEYGHVSSVEAYFVGQDQYSSNTLKFDKTGKKMEENLGDWQNIFYYDQNGFLKKLTNSFENETRLISEFQYSLDDQGNWIRRIEYVKGLPLQITEREIEYYQIPEMVFKKT